MLYDLEQNEVKLINEVLNTRKQRLYEQAHSLYMDDPKKPQSANGLDDFYYGQIDRIETLQKKLLLQKELKNG